MVYTYLTSRTSQDVSSLNQTGTSLPHTPRLASVCRSGAPRTPGSVSGKTPRFQICSSDPAPPGAFSTSINAVKPWTSTQLSYDQSKYAWMFPSPNLKSSAKFPSNPQRFPALLFHQAALVLRLPTVYKVWSYFLAFGSPNQDCDWRVPRPHSQVPSSQTRSAQASAKPAVKAQSFFLHNKRIAVYTFKLRLPILGISLFFNTFRIWLCVRYEKMRW